VLALTLLGLEGYLGWRHLQAWRHYGEAERALEKGEFAEARTHLDSCLRIWPGSAATHLLAARAARRANLLDEAAEHLDACAELGGPAETIALEEDLIRAQRGELEDVEPKLLACLSQDHPDSLLILEVITGQLMEAYRFPEAQAYLDLWLKRRPNDRLALVRCGWVREHLLDLEGAIQSYRRALDLDPKRDQRENDRVRLRLGQLLVQKYRARQAIEHFEGMYERQPHNQDVVLGLARCWRQLNRDEEAGKLLDAFLAKRPRSGQVLGERGRLALDRGLTNDAERWLREAATLCPYDRSIIFNLAKCLEALDKKTEAARYAARLSRIKADEQRMHQLMQEIRKSPREPALRHEVAKIFLRNGLHDDGMRWLKTAQQLERGSDARR
jgi:tetratricopeptide (TPR) repeat protein